MSSAATTIPTMVSVMSAHGNVSSCLSIHNPSSISPMIGTNILHVVSAIVPSNNKTVDLLFGGSLGVPSDLSLGSLMYTTYSSRSNVLMPYAKKTYHHSTQTIRTFCSVRSQKAVRDRGFSTQSNRRCNTYGRLFRTQGVSVSIL